MLFKDFNIIWRFTVFYGQPDTSKIKRTWRLLKILSRQSYRKWLVLGGFNEILSHSEKLGGPRTPKWRLGDFRETLTETDLIDLGYKGYRFTWNNNRHYPNNNQEMLDRVVATANWAALFPHTQVINISTRRSDHDVVLC